MWTFFNPLLLVTLRVNTPIQYLANKMLKRTPSYNKVDEYTLHWKESGL